MSCGAGKPNFRLLDAYVGWGVDDKAASISYLMGLDEPAGVHLELVNPGAVDPATVLAYLPPPRLARGCGACEWYLLTPKPPRSRLLRRDACHRQWHPVWSDPRFSEILNNAVAVATWRRWIAVADRGTNQVLIWTQSGERLIATIQVNQPGVIAFSPRGELLVTSADNLKIALYGLDGILRGWLSATPRETPNRIAVDSKNRVWIVTGSTEDSWKLWRADRDDGEFVSASADELKDAFPLTGIVAASEQGFCFAETAADGQAITSCFSWCGYQLGEGAIAAPKPPQVQPKGQLLTGPFDSGIPRCRWHRVRVDANRPAGTDLAFAVATAEDPNATPQGDSTRDPGWENFPAGTPHFSDWTFAPKGSLDFLIDQPPGRYLYFRMRLIGSGSASPLVRRVRIDFPRATSLEYLPDVYRENPKAEDFTERFLSLFDVSIADLDRTIERYPALLDPSGVPEQVLPWLGGFFDVGFDPAWDADKRRRILQAVPQLYRQRGTIAGLQSAINLAFGVKPAVQELFTTTTWGALAGRKTGACACATTPSPKTSAGPTARLGTSRLFGKTRARMRLNRSAIGKAPLRSYGDPGLDPFASGAYRFRVLVPAWPNISKQDRERLTNLIELQKPAHTVASVRVGGEGFLLGKWSAVGVDTSFVSLPPPILGSAGNVRLNRTSILWHGRGGAADGAVLGQNFVLGMQTIAE